MGKENGKNGKVERWDDVPKVSSWESFGGLGDWSGGVMEFWNDSVSESRKLLLMK
jgi:hypothetical protein